VNDTVSGQRPIVIELYLRIQVESDIESDWSQGRPETEAGAQRIRKLFQRKVSWPFEHIAGVIKENGAQPAIACVVGHCEREPVLRVQDSQHLPSPRDRDPRNLSSRTCFIEAETPKRCGSSREISY